MTPRAAACALLLPCVSCLGCRQAQDLRQAPDPALMHTPAAAQRSQLGAVTEDPRFILQTTHSFFAKPTGASTDDFSR
jgi:hypothetical protein